MVQLSNSYQSIINAERERAFSFFVYTRNISKTYKKLVYIIVVQLFDWIKTNANKNKNQFFHFSSFHIL